MTESIKIVLGDHTHYNDRTQIIQLGGSPSYFNYMRSDTEEILTHEFLHHLLFFFISREACVKLDNICSFFGYALEDWEWTEDFTRIKPEWIIEWLLG